jgi:fluoroacetyl-CoA thioesterase
MALEPGLKGEITLIVEEQHTAAAYGSGLVPVLSTPHLVALLESAAKEAVQPYLQEGQSTVGTLVNIRHLAATPIGMQVRATAELLSVEGRRLRFHVEAWDEQEKIGEGEHERFIIDWARFMARVSQKRGS